MSRIESALQEARRCLDAWLADPETLPKLNSAADMIAASLQGTGKAMACGNGGSMADAMHFAEELTGRFRADRPAYPALALSDPTHITCVGNDYGFEHIFSRGVEALGQPGDVLLVLSTSGSSPNVVNAAKAARQRNIKVIGFLGKGGGALLPLCDLAILAPGETSDRIQELHMLGLHAVIEQIEVLLEDA